RRLRKAFYPAEVERGLAPRLGERHALGQVRGDLPLAVEAELGLEPAFGNAAAQQRAAAAVQDSDPAHTRLLFLIEYQPDGGREPLPLRLLALQMLAAGAGEGVVAGLAVVLGAAPLGPHPALRVEPVQRRVERPLPHLQGALRDQTDALRDAPAVQRLGREGAQD